MTSRGSCEANSSRAWSGVDGGRRGQSLSQILLRVDEDSDATLADLHAMRVSVRGSKTKLLSYGLPSNVRNSFLHASCVSVSESETVLSQSSRSAIESCSSS